MTIDPKEARQRNLPASARSTLTAFGNPLRGKRTGFRVLKNHPRVVFDIPKGKRVFIIEGVSGSGKSTLLKQLAKRFPKATCFSEEELLFDWRDNLLPGVTEFRLQLFGKVMDLLEKGMGKKGAFFILERFHLSLKVLDYAKDAGLEKRYARLIARLRNLPVHVFLLTKQNKSHRERGKDWKSYLAWKRKASGSLSLREMYAKERALFLKLARSQHISFSAV